MAAKSKATAARANAHRLNPGRLNPFSGLAADLAEMQPIDRDLSRLGDVVTGLSMAADDLEKRLQRVMTPPGEALTSNEAAAVPVTTEVGQAIDLQTLKIMVVQRQLLAILNRLGL